MINNVFSSTSPIPIVTPAELPQKCNHKWVYQLSHYSHESCAYNDHFIRMDEYYCEKCLDIKEMLKENYCRESPLWWIH